MKRADNISSGGGGSEKTAPISADKMKMAMGRLDRVNDEIEKMLEDDSISDEIRKSLNAILEERDRDDSGLYKEEDTPERLKAINNRFKLEKEQFLALQKQNNQERDKEWPKKDKLIQEKETLTTAEAEAEFNFKKTWISKDENRAPFRVLRYSGADKAFIVKFDVKRNEKERIAKMSAEELRDRIRDGAYVIQGSEKTKGKNKDNTVKTQVDPPKESAWSEKENADFDKEWQEKEKSKKEQAKVAPTENIVAEVEMPPVLPENFPSDVNVDNPGISAERKAEAGRLRREISEGLKRKMDAAEQRWLKKKNENTSFATKLKGMIIKGVTFGQTEREERIFRAEFEEAKARYEEIADKVEDREGEITEKEIEVLPEEERKKMGMGFRNIGFFVEKWKNDLFVRVTKGVVRLEDGEHIADKGGFARFMHSLSENFQKNSDQARSNIKKSNTEDPTSLKQLSNVGYLFGNAIKYGKIAADLIGKTAGSFPRYAMMGAMALGTGADAFKEARLNGSEAMDKTRISDSEVAAQEAWTIYAQAQKGDDSVTPTRDEIEKYYQRSIPQDVLKRLEAPLSLSACGLLEFCIKKDVGGLTNRIAKKIDEIENNASYSPEKKEQEKDKVQKKYAEYLNMFDRLVTQAGEVDAWAMTAQYIKTGTKTVVWGVGLETLVLMTQKLVEEAPAITQKTDDLIKFVSELVSEQEHHGASGVVDIAQNTESIPVDGTPVGSVATEVSAGEVNESFVPETEKVIELEPIENGGNIEASIRDHFRANPDLVEKYSQLNGGRKFDAGQIAHRMFLEYGDNHDLVHAGAQVNLSADGMHIENVTGDEHSGFLPTEKVAVDPSEVPSADIVEQVTSGDATAYEGFMHQVEDYFSPEEMKDSAALYDRYPEFKGIANYDAEMARLGEELSDSDSQTDLSEKIQALSELKVLRERFAENYTKILKTFLDFKTGYSQEALNTTNARDFVQGPSEGKTLKIFKALRVTMSAEQIKQFKIDPTNNDTILTWSKRVTNFMLKKISEK